MVNSPPSFDPAGSANRAILIVFDSNYPEPERAEAAHHLCALAAQDQDGLNAVLAVIDEKRFESYIKDRDRPELGKAIRNLNDVVRDQIEGSMNEYFLKSMETIISNEQIEWLNDIAIALKLAPEWKVQKQQGDTPQAVLNVCNEKNIDYIANLLSNKGIETKQNTHQISIDGLKLQKLTIDMRDCLIEILRITYLRPALNKSTEVVSVSSDGNSATVPKWTLNLSSQEFQDFLSLESDNRIFMDSYSQALRQAHILHEYRKDDTGLTILKIPCKCFSTVTAENINAITNPGPKPSTTPNIGTSSNALIALKRPPNNLQSSALGF